MGPSRRRIGYVLSRFPVLSQTFVLNEILAMEARGLEVEIFSLAQPRDPRFHENIAHLKASIRYLPHLSEFGSLRDGSLRAWSSFGRRYARACARHCRSLSPARFREALQAGCIAEHVRERRITHLHAHFANVATDVARLVHGITGVPYSFTAHAFDIYSDDTDRSALAAKIRDALFVVTVSDSNVAFLREIAPTHAGKIRRIYNGIDLDHFSVERPGRGDPIRILCVARLVEKKGIDVLIRACGLLRDRDHRFRCHIVGDGERRRNLADLVDALQLGGRVRLCDVATQNEIVSHYRDADLFVLPCLVARDGNREGLPVSIVEALACGLPVISTPVTGIPEAVRHEFNGLLVTEGDAAGLAEAIERTIARPDLLRRLQRNARASIVDRFDQTVTYGELYRALGGADAQDRPRPLEAVA